MAFQGFKKQEKVVAGATQDKIKSLMIMSARWGTYMAHQAYMQRDLHRLVRGLYRVNYPDQKIPNDIHQRLDQYTDKKSGDTFAEITHRTVMDDWANSISTHDASAMISEIDETTTPAKLLDLIGKQTEELRQIFNKHHDEVSVAKEGYLDNLHLN